MQKSIVLSNTSPLYYLYTLGKLDLLKKLFGKLFVPEAVIQELKTGSNFTNNLYTQEYSWIKIESVTEISTEISEVEGLGKGEAEVIALADIKKDPLLIIDDMLGRRIAMSRGYTITGTCGILILAKKMNLIKKVKPIFESLQESGFYLSDKHMDILIKKIDE